MKIHLFILALAGLAASGLAQETPAPTPSAPTAAAANPSAGLTFDFRGAPLDSVLEYMSNAAGYVVVRESPVTGSADMIANHPVTRQQAAYLLGLELNKAGYSLQVHGDILVVSSKEDARKQEIPIHTGADPSQIPETAEMVMQIIPLQHIDARQTLSDLGDLFPSSAQVTANEDSNSLVVTDTEINIHHIVELVADLDKSSESNSETRVFHLKNADPTEMATLIMNVFATPNGTGTTNGGGGRGGFAALGAIFGGFGGRGGGAGNTAGATGAGNRGGGNGGGNRGGGGFGGGTNGRSTGSGRAIPIVATPDPRTLSVVVTASTDQMPAVEEMISQLDSSEGRKQHAYSIPIVNADVVQVQAILQNLFASSQQRTTTTQQADPLNTRETTNASATSNSATNVNLVGSSSSTGGH